MKITTSKTTQSPLLIRPAAAHDMLAVRKIYEEVVLNTTATFEEQTPSLAEFLQAFEEKKVSGHAWFVAELQNEVVGYGTYGSFRKASGYKTSVEHSVHVRADQRGQGVGSQLLAHLISHARQQGFHAMIAAVDGANESSLRLHEKLGFTVVGRLPQIAKKFSRWLDLVLLQLQL